MTAERTPERVAIVVTFRPGGDDPQVDLGAASIAQVALAAWELGQLAIDARHGQVMAEARAQAEVRSMAAGLRQLPRQ